MPVSIPLTVGQLPPGTGAGDQNDRSGGKMLRDLDGHHSSKRNAHQYGVVFRNTILQTHPKGISFYRFADDREEPFQMNKADTRYLQTGKNALVRAQSTDAIDSSDN